MREFLARQVRTWREDRGVSIIMSAITMMMMLSFAALALDISQLYVVKNELQNAADAGALAGASALYLNDGTAVDPNSNQIAYDTAISNLSKNSPVDVHWAGGNAGDVQRGHWSFTTKTFTPNDSLAAYDLWNVPDTVIDTDPNFINAVKVTTRREDTPVAALLASIFGQDSFVVTADAVAYRGFAGSLAPGEVDQPIAICEEAIREGGIYSCNIGRMISSGGGSNPGADDTTETGAWTSFEQSTADEDVCSGGTNSSELRSVICSGGNPRPIDIGIDMATTNGMVASGFNDFRDCWLSEADSDGDGTPDQPWGMTLPVIDCDPDDSGPVATTCSKVRGAVNVEVVWITETGTTSCNTPSKLPMIMGDWSCPAEISALLPVDPLACFNDFVAHYSLENYAGAPANCNAKTVYFKPSCEYVEPRGTSGGSAFGVLSNIPVLVE